ncbi:RNA-directed DNA polymerase, eukaryota, reverse transcriptase zinc-binding domain protein [Tanacetum coccineum]
MRNKIRPYMKYIMGNGKDISTWHDMWIGNDSLSKFISHRNLIENKMDKGVWIDKKNKEVNFSVGRAWKDFREEHEKLDWEKIIWFSRCIPKHSFISWIAMHQRLSTQDRIIKWFLEE